jgi:Putative peptidoglycan binding domain
MPATTRFRQSRTDRDNVDFSSCPAVIAYGQVGNCVIGVQRLLHDDPPHAAITADGIFGQATVMATRNFQARHHLPADGVAGPPTIDALRRLAPGSGSGSIPVAVALLTALAVDIVPLVRMAPPRVRSSYDRGPSAPLSPRLHTRSNLQPGIKRGNPDSLPPFSPARGRAPRATDDSRTAPTRTSEETSTSPHRHPAATAPADADQPTRPHPAHRRPGRVSHPANPPASPARTRPDLRPSVPPRTGRGGILDTRMPPRRTSAGPRPGVNMTALPRWRTCAMRRA